MGNYVCPPIFITIPIKINIFGLRLVCPLKGTVLLKLIKMGGRGVMWRTNKGEGCDSRSYTSAFGIFVKRRPSFHQITHTMMVNLLLVICPR